MNLILTVVWFLITNSAVTQVMTKRCSRVKHEICIEQVTYSLSTDIYISMEHEHKNRKLTDYRKSDRKVTLIDETIATKKVDISEDRIHFELKSTVTQNIYFKIVNEKMTDYQESDKKVLLVDETGATKKVDISEDRINFEFKNAVTRNTNFIIFTSIRQVSSGSSHRMKEVEIDKSVPLWKSNIVEGQMDNSRRDQWIISKEIFYFLILFMKEVKVYSCKQWNSKKLVEKHTEALVILSLFFEALSLSLMTSMKSEKESSLNIVSGLHSHLRWLCA